jgi:glycerol-3-phosphate dehydrogenase
MAGVRALVRREGVRESEVSRKHVLHDHEAKGEASGLLSVAGGKITGYRAIAEDAVDLAGRKLGHRADCTTARRPLPGAPPDLRPLETELGRGTEGLRLAKEQRQYLMAQYGRRSTAVLNLASDCSELAERVCPDQPTIKAEIVHAAREEAAVGLIDVLLRRTPLGLAPGHALEAAPRVAAILGRELDWDASTQAAEVEQYRRHLARLYTPDGEAAPP